MSSHPPPDAALSASSLLALGPSQTESSSPVPLPLCSIFLSCESFRHHRAASGPVPTTAPGRCPSANEHNSLVNAKILLKKFTGEVCSLRFQLISFFQNHGNGLACAKCPHTHYFISTPSRKSTIHTSRICKQKLKD